MNVLILGGTGMAGHMIYHYLRNHTELTAMYTTRNKLNNDGVYLDLDNNIDSIASDIKSILNKYQINVIINCIGILPQESKQDICKAITLNSLLPHILEKISLENQIKLIHLSTDCVFSGKDGSYTEKSLKDGTDNYSRSKNLGEIFSEDNLILRTSFIGPDIKENGVGLFSWFMRQKESINGYREVYWSGVTTLELAKIIEYCIKNNIKGLYQCVNNSKISKYDLLVKVKDTFNKNDININKYTGVISDKSLICEREDINYKIPNYDKMIEELCDYMNLYSELYPHLKNYLTRSKTLN
ncbi:sugar nucleotide-binding protein [Bacillus toyonensis]|uniref:sugar nucleotide-binding protein n=1 Tax=Bacillus toyonensis TaxID=155322 RepID=UPI0018D179DE|nr:sugar nucleotide-binding protein [Bacillus toyonensis]MBH0357119.1 NAD(P)-dependent oxidoreductase [Bacillus toyonensis biovar Thuringiensis]